MERAQDSMKTEKTGRRPARRLLFFSLVCAVCLTGCGKDSGEWEKSVIEEQIVIQGISGEYDLLFLTDSHVVSLGEAAENGRAQTENGEAQAGTGAQDEESRRQEYAASRYEGFCGQDGTSSQEMFAQAMDYAREEGVDGVLLGGDIIDSPSQENLTFLSEELSTLSMPYLYTPGNHDWTYPWEYMTSKGKQEYLPMLSPYMGGNTAFHTLDFGEFVVAAVDNSSGQVNPEALEEYEEVLDQGKPVIVLAHVPFLTQSVLTKAREVWKSGVVIGGGNFGGIYPDETSQEFLEMTTASDSPVVAVLAGHVHFYDKDVIEGEKDVPQIVGDALFHGSALRLRITGRG